MPSVCLFTLWNDSASPQTVRKMSHPPLESGVLASLGWGQVSIPWNHRELKGRVCRESTWGPLVLIPVPSLSELSGVYLSEVGTENYTQRQTHLFKFIPHTATHPCQHLAGCGKSTKHQLLYPLKKQFKIKRANKKMASDMIRGDGGKSDKRKTSLFSLWDISEMINLVKPFCYSI